MSTTLRTLLGISHPIVQAPMAGGPTTPELVAAVSGAGGLGSVGAAYLTPAQILEAASRIRALTSAPFSINLFSGGYSRDSGPGAEEVRALLAEIHVELGIPAPSIPQVPPDPFPEQVDAVIQARPALFSFTFGIPDAPTLARVRRGGILTAGTATTMEEGRILAEAGVDAIVAQGGEAGGHRGTFAGPFEASLVPTAELVQQIVAAVDLPVFAAGGLMDGADIARMMQLGAAGALLGTAFLACPESGAPAAHKQALLEVTADTTVLTRAFSGRLARGLRNGFIDRLAAAGITIPPYPLQNMLTRPMRSAAAGQGRAEFLSLWAGQGVTRIRSLPAAELVAQLRSEMEAAAGSASSGAGRRG